jgi:HEAT repeat protein
MLRQLKDRLREFGQTPLLLWMLCGLFRQTGQIPTNLGEVFRAFTQGYEKNLKADVPVESDRAWWQPVLQQLAWVMMQGTQPTELRVAIQEEEAVRVIAQFLQDKVPHAVDFARKCLRDLQKHHLIQVGANREELEFRHQLLQEYYAAEALLGQLPHLSDIQLKQAYLNYLKWIEALALMLALVEDQAQATRVVRLAIELDLMLAARLAGEVKPEFQGQTVEIVNKLKVLKCWKLGLIKIPQQIEVPTWLKVELLTETRSKSAMPGLLKLLGHSDSSVRGQAAEALGKLGSEAAISGLLKRLEDSESFVRWHAACALGKIGSETAIPGLLKLLEDSDSSMRGCAANALGKIGTEATIPRLLKLLEDSDSFVRWHAACALGKIGTEAAIPRLLKLLEHSNSFVRWHAARALGEIGTEAAIPGLLRLLEHSNSSVRWHAAETLGKIGTEAAIPRLLKLLEDSDSLVRWHAAEALGEIGTEAAIPRLLKLLEDSDSFVRRHAAEALGKIGTEAAIPRLLKLLEDSDSLVRCCAANALGKIGTEAAIPRLLKWLEDSDSLVRCCAANALGNIAKKYASTIAPYLPHLLILIPTKSVQAAHRVMRAVQENCKYYNYNIYQAYLETQKRDQSKDQTNDHSKIINNNFPNATEIKIFENINQYHEAPSKNPSS